MATKRKKNKNGRGRPPTNHLPPRIDTTPEEMAQILFRTPPTNKPVSGRDYFCRDCKQQVVFPAILYADNRCEKCHQAAV